jgi:L-ascorbate metabolism protein UlaG (beta-lactamase superfamily)
MIRPLPMMKSFATLAASTAALLAAASTAFALCAPVAEAPRARAWPAVDLPKELPPKGSVEITYIGHSTFLIRTPGNVSIATDYNDHIRPPITPTIATMNRAHNTHFSYSPDPKIKHVLPGWKDGGVAEHNLVEGDVKLFNIPTNIRNWENRTTDYGGNSIFVYEAGGLCIAHLGHLHHTLTPEHLKRMGPIDIVMIAVDGSVTLTQEGALEVVEQIRPKVVIPMHFFGEVTLERFAALFAGKYPTKRSESPTVIFSRANLPDKQLLILPGF